MFFEACKVLFGYSNALTKGGGGGSGGFVNSDRIGAQCLECPAVGAVLQWG